MEKSRPEEICHYCYWTASCPINGCRRATGHLQEHRSIGGVEADGQWSQHFGNCLVVAGGLEVSSVGCGGIVYLKVVRIGSRSWEQAMDAALGPDAEAGCAGGHQPGGGWAGDAIPKIGRG